MRELSIMKATYLRKLTAIYAGTTLAPAVSQMAVEYNAKMTDLRDKQLLAKDVMNAAAIPGGRQSGMQMITNKFWYLQTIQDYGDPTATIEFVAAFAYFKAKFAWVVAEQDCVKSIAQQVFNITIP
jgi:hypothetical protein